jgi:hypothetical protein
MLGGSFGIGIGAGGPGGFGVGGGVVFQVVTPPGVPADAVPETLG